MANENFVGLVMPKLKGYGKSLRRDYRDGKKTTSLFSVKQRVERDIAATDKFNSMILDDYVKATKGLHERSSRLTTEYYDCIRKVESGVQSQNHFNNQRDRSENMSKIMSSLDAINSIPEELAAIDQQIVAFQNQAMALSKEVTAEIARHTHAYLSAVRMDHKAFEKLELSADCKVITKEELFELNKDSNEAREKVIMLAQTMEV